MASNTTPITPAARALPGDGPTHLVARARVPRFRRAGLPFTDRYRGIPLRDLSASQLKDLEGEPMLDVRRVTVEQMNLISAEGGEESTPEIPEIDRLRAKVKDLDRESDRLRADLRDVIERGKLSPP